MTRASTIMNKNLDMYHKVLYSEAMEEFYTIREISKILQLKAVTIRRWIAKGLLPAYNLNKEYRVNKQDFDKFMKQRKVRSGK